MKHPRTRKTLSILLLLLLVASGVSIPLYLQHSRQEAEEAAYEKRLDVAIGEYAKEIADRDAQERDAEEEAARLKAEAEALEAARKSAEEEAARILTERKASTIILNAPIITQRPELPTGCEITAITMLLLYKGATVDKLTLAQEMPYHDSDFELGYVGSPYDYTGQTIYPPALMALVSRYAGSARDLSGSTLEDLRSSIDTNRPVVVWGSYAGLYLHSILVTGYDAYGFYYNDPWTGAKNAYLTSATFLSKWNVFGRRAISY